jgi:hypothetical protein
MSRRTPETLVDWLVVGIAPFLIMLLVGSLVFYLVEVFYLGNYPLRLLWVLGLFVMAIVCIARISMEEGAAYASMYAVPLAGAVGLALTVFVEVKGPLAVLGPALNWILMGIVWWSAHKLTWDCTLIEGGRDFTGQGLMQTTGLDRFFRVKVAESVPATAEPQTPPPDLSGTSSTTPTAALPVWKWWQSEHRPHAPGVWVVYFSIAALPLFGLGQWFMPTDGLDLRRRAFWLLVIYVAAGLSLLMATSFLSLRRYLRQRNLEMPGEMAAVWLGTGAAMIFILLLLASFLPRPIPEYSITHLAPQIKSPELNPSRWGWGQEGTKPKPGSAQTATKGETPQDDQQTSPQGQPSPNAKGKDQANSSSGSSGSGSQKSSSKSENRSQANNSDNKQNSEPGKSSQSDDSSKSSSSKTPSSSDQPPANNSQQSTNKNKTNPPSDGSPQNNAQSPPQNPNNDPNNNSQSPTNPPAESQQTPPLPNETQVPPPTNYLAQAMEQVFAYLAHALKWLFYLLVIGVIAYFAWQHRERLFTAWQQLIRELRELWNKWFGQKTVAEAASAPVAAAPPPKRFAEYADPFTTGLAARWSLAELVRYTFEALEARGREQNCPRSNDQTPLEYAAAVGQVEPAFASEFRSLADLYGQLAFARGTASPQSTSLLQQLWQRWK